MSIFAISDLHLPGGTCKPMDVFGAHWAGHFERICTDWRARVQADDLVLLPGDLSWAMQMEQALPDLYAIGALPGRKVLLRGNHDYWWNGIGRVRAALPAGMFALQNDALRFGRHVLCGTRGWLCPGAQQFGAEDERIYRREVQRLELSLQQAVRRAEEGPEPGELLAMMHYPPFAEKETPTGFTALLEAFGVRTVVYGHLHGAALQSAFSGELRGTVYHQVSCDGLHFALKRIAGDETPRAEKSCGQRGKGF